MAFEFRLIRGYAKVTASVGALSSFWFSAGTYGPHPSFGHVQGALIVMSTVLAKSSSKEDHDTAKNLQRMAAAIGPRNLIDSSMRSAIAELMTHEDLDRRLQNLDLYLESL